jgi:hypothetical protein
MRNSIKIRVWNLFGGLDFRIWTFFGAWFGRSLFTQFSPVNSGATSKYPEHPGMKKATISEIVAL